ncbi:MAG: redoxin domain-containing protein [Bacteroidota bacterium]
MRLEREIAAPYFKEKDIFDRVIDLNDYRDKKVLIGFFRHAGCPFCNLRVHTLMKEQEELKALGLEMIFFFESKESVLLRSTFHKEVSPVPLISDPEKVCYDAYGLESSGYKSAIGHIQHFVQTAIKAKSNGLPVHAMADGESIKTMPAEFLLGEGLVIKKLHYCERLADRMSMDEIMDFAKS